MINRRHVLVAATAGLATVISPVKINALKAAEIGDNGLYTQDWFYESFLDFAEDQATATAEGKHLAVIFEQRGCSYCKELHQVNFARDDIRDYAKKNFVIVQLDLWGSRETTDFDGQELEERALARKWRINFTPTIIFFAKSDPKTGRPKDQQAEIFRMPGYFKPYHFLAMLEFIHEEQYRTKGFQRFLLDKADQSNK